MQGPSIKRTQNIGYTQENIEIEEGDVEVDENLEENENDQDVANTNDANHECNTLETSCINFIIVGKNSPILKKSLCCWLSDQFNGRVDTDTVYPEHLSRLRRRVVPKKRKGGSSRYRTQPITFSEIQEVDEDNVPEETASCRATSIQELQHLNEKFEMFRRDSDLVFYSSKEEPKDSAKSLGRISPPVYKNQKI
ncbi:unnamed protein product [Ceutorhynchus assimilis]|uniref:Uncharacterized protein n=1 Tax=Ceutorhynchus assimilis TaxID=467358 RepID=A0A9N9QPQ1_9CUCU|nr:unnamed protein product [Ceutorhynchus assimilis]